MRQKIRRTTIILLLIAALAGGFFKIKEYRNIKAEENYGYCTTECSEEYENNREYLNSDESYENCLGVCGDDYEKITGRIITPIYKTLKEEWRLQTSP